MIKLLGTLVLLGTAFCARGQGTALFNNRVIPHVDCRMVLPDGRGAGTGWKAQLYGGPVGGPYKFLEPITTFRTNSEPAKGYVNPVDVIVPSVAPGRPATLVMCAFNGETWEKSTLRYQSNPVTLTLGGGMGALPPPLFGLERFTLVAETGKSGVTTPPPSQPATPASKPPRASGSPGKSSNVR